MDKIDKNTILRFARILAGHYSNKQQSQKKPRAFAHINIYFQPLPWSILQGPGFYSEQSFDYSPWSPYRQAVHGISVKDKSIIMSNFFIKDPIKIAGAGFNSSLLSVLQNVNLEPRQGCAMNFKENSSGNYQGEVEPGKKCIVYRDDKKTYLKSNVEFNDQKWKSLDQGYEVNTDHLIWGSENGPLEFEKVISSIEIINENWTKFL